jgi:hypothetical protein
METRVFYGIKRNREKDDQKRGTKTLSPTNPNSCTLLSFWLVV